MTIAEFGASYWAFNRISDARRKDHVLVLRHFEQSSGRSIADIDAESFRVWLGAVMDSGRKPNTVSKWSTIVRCYVRHAWEMGALDSERCMRILAVKDPRGLRTRMVPRPYSKGEIRGIYHWIDTTYPLAGTRRLLRFEGDPENLYMYAVYKHLMNMQMKAVLTLALDCGLRRAEIHGATIDDISPRNQFVVVRMGKSRVSDEPRYREVPFTDVARNTIGRWLDARLWFLAIYPYNGPAHASPWLVLHPAGQNEGTGRGPGKPIPLGLPPGWPMSEHIFEGLFYDPRRGGEWQLHRMRHTAATNWLRAGMPLEAVSRLLGHSNITQTLGYADLDRHDISRHATRVEGAFNKLMGERT